jgi:F-box interacting protein
VSKEWYALIADPGFHATHKSRVEPLLIVGSRRYNSLLLIDMEGSVVKVINGVGSVWKLICGSRDNLTCVITRIEDVKVIDLANGSEVLVTTWKDGLWGFGCSIPSSVYKLVYIKGDTCEILTLGDSVGWRQMQLPPTSNVSYSSNPVVVNGMMHLMLKSYSDGNNVLCFNLETEEWKKGIKGPPNVDLRRCDLALSEINGSLCMVQPVLQGIDGLTNIWLLTDPDKSTWVKRYTVSLDSSWFSRLIPLRMLHEDTKLLFCDTHEGTDVWIAQVYDSCRLKCTDAPKALDGAHDTNFSPCSCTWRVLFRPRGRALNLPFSFLFFFEVVALMHMEQHLMLCWTEPKNL